MLFAPVDVNQISIPAPARGRTGHQSQTARRFRFQFPPPRGGEPQQPEGLTALGCISIPAPARGRTVARVANGVQSFISIPAPARGRTRGGYRRAGPEDFNSRPREGANRLSSPAHRQCRYFNSRPREGANCKTVQNRAVYLVSLLKFGRISAILPYILSATRAKNVKRQKS